eukprot:9058926-Alexandrium_andersonii.AAC.1
MAGSDTSAAVVEVGSARIAMGSNSGWLCVICFCFCSCARVCLSVRSHFANTGPCALVLVCAHTRARFCWCSGVGTAALVRA